MCYTQICPRFDCRDEHTIHTCVYCVLTLNAGPGRGELGVVSRVVIQTVYIPMQVMAADSKLEQLSNAYIIIAWNGIQ